MKALHHRLFFLVFLYSLFLTFQTAYPNEHSPQFTIVLGTEFELSDHDIESYDWETHTIELSLKATRRIDSLWPYPGSILDHPRDFFIKVGDQEIYSGRIISPIMSSIPKGPLLSWPLSHKIKISYRGDNDPRIDARVKKVLQELLILKEAEFSGEGHFTKESQPRFSIFFEEEIQFSDNDIIEYCWETHTITLSAEARDRFDSRWPIFNFKRSQPNSFSVKVNGELIYGGSIPFSLSSSSFPDGLAICWPFNLSGWTGFTIYCSTEKDPRFSRKIRTALLGLGVLQENCSDQLGKVEPIWKTSQ